MGDLQKAIEYHEKHLKIKKETGDRAKEVGAYGNLGDAYDSLDDFRKAFDYHEKHFKISIEIGDRAEERETYGNLSIPHELLADFRKPIEYRKKYSKIALEIGDLAEEGIAYGNLGNVYFLPEDSQKAIEYHEKHLKIAKEMGDRTGEGKLYETLMSSVGIIHIAAHGNKRTGEIALSPNSGWTSRFPQKKDFILQMSDVLAANLRARLVVLSCCHSGRGRLLKGEGVVGIARAFLAAGARSVLISLWAIDDEATMVFMKSFYQHLKEGKTASAAVHQPIKSLRESEEFSKMRYWAPFQLIGDNVKIEFEMDDDVKNWRNNSVFSLFFCQHNE